MFKAFIESSKSITMSVDTYKKFLQALRSAKAEAEAERARANDAEMRATSSKKEAEKNFTRAIDAETQAATNLTKVFALQATQQDLEEELQDLQQKLDMEQRKRQKVTEQCNAAQKEHAEIHKRVEEANVRCAEVGRKLRGIR